MHRLVKSLRLATRPPASDRSDGSRLNRARLFACIVVAALVLVSSAFGQSIALTFDDGPNMTDNIGLSAAEKNAAILEQLARANLKSFLFVTRVDNDSKRNDLIRQWGQRGHLVGNHTATHPDLDQVSLAAYQQDFLICDRAIREVPGYTRRFRFPFLKEGNTREKRDGMRAFLDSNAYKPAPVSVDTSDWYYSERLSDRLRVNPKADRMPYRDAYLHHLDDRTNYYDGLARTVLGRSVAHVMLLHHNLINALFLSDVIAMLRAKGWKLIDAEVAFQDAVYEARPDVIPAGESIIWALARQKGIADLRYPGEDDVYEKPLLDRLRL